MQAAGAPDLLQILLQADDAVGDQAAVGLDLRLAGATQEAEAAALPFKVGPGPHQAAALVVQMGEFHLQGAFLGAGALTEDIQDQAGAIDDLAAPGALQIALLHRGQRGVHHRDRDIPCLQRLVLRRGLALAQQGRGPPGAERQDGGVDHHQAD